MEQKRNKTESLPIEPAEKHPHGNTNLREAREDEPKPCGSSARFEPGEEIRGVSAELEGQRRRVFELEASLNERAAAAGDLYNELAEIWTSRGWKALRKVYSLREKLFPFGSRRREILNYVLRQRQTDGAAASPPPESGNPDLYQLWIRLHEPSPEELRKLRTQAQKFSYAPTVSIQLSITSPEPELLKRCMESLQAQVYGKWKLSLGGNRPGSGDAERVLYDYAKRDPRLRVMEASGSPGQGESPSAASAPGELVAFLDAEDTLAPDALYRVIEHLQEHPDAAAIYADEDQQDANGNRSKPFFKPDWSPELFLSFDYTGHFAVVRRELIPADDTIRNGYATDQLCRLLLLLNKAGKQIHHIPRVLYHRRRRSAATSDRDIANGDARREILRDYFATNRIAAHAESGLAAGTLRVRYEIKENVKVAIVIPTGGRLDLLRACLESVFAKTEYRPYEVTVVDNSKGSETQALAASMAREGLGYLDCRGRPFNFSVLNNLAVSSATAPLILFLNDDTEVTNGDWLSSMAELGQRPTVGAVGAKLLYPSGRIQHAGIVMGIHECASNAFKGVDDSSREYYFGLPHVIRESSAVTAACMLTQRDLFLKLGGFNERELAVSFQDPDYCLRVREAGFAVLYTPFAVLVHRESVSKGPSVNAAEIRYLRKKWKAAIAHDPYYNPNLTRTSEDFRLKLD